MRVAILAFMLILSLSFAEDYVAVNSVDGRDVLSGVSYAGVKDLPVKFMPKPGGDADLFAIKVGSGHDILLIQGNVPVSGLVATTLQTNNNTIELYASANGLTTNLDLAHRSGASTFIIVDSAYADSALSVLPYATLTDSYVLFADKNNIEDVMDVVSGKQVILYGYLDQEVMDELSVFNPDVIGDGEDKFVDNLIIVERTMDEFPNPRVIVSDGTFIEDSMATTGSPIILIGKTVPSVTYDFVKQKVSEDELKETLLLGNALVNPVYDMRERVRNDMITEEGLNKTFLITVKFAQMIPGASGTIGLDTFALPSYRPTLNISEVVYNTASQDVMLSIENIGEGPAYYVAEIIVTVDGEEFDVLTNAETALIERGDTAGLTFPLDLSSVVEGEINASVVVKYGPSKTSLDDFAYYDGELASISYIDNSSVAVQDARYNPDNKVLLVTIRNNGDETAYVLSKLSVILDGAPVTISSPTVREIPAGSLIVEEFPFEMTEEDLKANKEATIYLQYGARKGFLVKEDRFTMPLEQDFPLLLVGGIILLLLILLYFLFRKKEEKRRKK